MADGNARRRGVEIYRAAEAVDLTDTDFMSSPTMSNETQAEFGQAIAAGAAFGGILKVLVRQSRDEGGFSLVHCWFKPEYPLVRHSHDVDCLYYVISGSASMGNQTLRAGDSFFVPANAPYLYTAGPDGVEVLEVRHNAEEFDIKIPDAPQTWWQELVAVSHARREAWTAATTSPTFAANRP